MVGLEHYLTVAGALFVIGIFGIFLNRKVMVASIISFVASQSPSFAEVQVLVPSDPKANYFVLDLFGTGEGIFEITTRREGPSGISYAIRKVTCDPFMFGYIADSDDEAGLEIRDDNPEMSELVSGSISDVISRYACNNG